MHAQAQEVRIFTRARGDVDGQGKYALGEARSTQTLYQEVWSTQTLYQMAPVAACPGTARPGRER